MRHLLLAVAVVAGLATAAPVAVASGPSSPSGPRNLGGQSGTAVSAGTYHNPLDLRDTDGSPARSCADPNVIHGRQPGDHYWYLYCTTDPFRGTDVTPSGDLRFHLIPMFRSLDLVHWTHAGDAFAERPSWVKSDAGMWAPDVVFANGRYYLYYAASATNLPGGGSAVGVATAPTPTGPWTDSGTPVVPPDPEGHWKFDPEVIFAGGHAYIYFGSYFGGVFARTLSADLLTSDPATEQQIAIANRYEGTNIVRHGGWYYFLGSATNCCNGPLTGYAVFAARSRSPLGPFVDRDGHSILEAGSAARSC